MKEKWTPEPYDMPDIDHYTYTGLYRSNIDKFSEVDDKYFYYILKKDTVSDIINFDDNDSIKYYAYRNIMLIKINDLIHSFEYNYDYTFLELEKISNTSYKYLHTKTSSSDGDSKKYYTYINIVDGKIIVNDEEAYSLMMTYDSEFDRCVLRLMSIKLHIIQELGIDKVYNEFVSNKIVNKYKL